MIVSFLLSLALHKQISVFFLGTMTPEFLNSLDGLAIVRPVGRDGVEHRTITDSNGSRDGRVALDRYQVIVSTGTLPEQVQILSLPVQRGSTFSPLNQPGNYLVVFSRTDRGLARFIQHERTSRRSEFERWSTQDSLAVAAEVNEIAPFLILSTRSNSILPGSDFCDSIVKNVIECLRGSSAEEAAIACVTLRNITFARSARTARVLSTSVRTPKAFDTLLKGAAAGASPSVRARIEALRERWQLPDTDFSFYRAIREAKADRQLFNLPIDILGGGVALGDPIGSPEHGFIEPSEVAQLGLEHESLAARTLLVGSMPSPPSRSWQVRLLDSLDQVSDDTYRMNVLTRFARWYKDSGKLPKFRGGIIQKQAELVAHWRQALRD